MIVMIILVKLSKAVWKQNNKSNNKEIKKTKTVVINQWQ